jgi:hypothetical protein
MVKSTQRPLSRQLHTCDEQSNAHCQACREDGLPLVSNTLTTPTQQPPTLEQQLAALVQSHGIPEVLRALAMSCADAQCEAEVLGHDDLAQECEYAVGDLERIAQDLDNAQLGADLCDRADGEVTL